MGSSPDHRLLMAWLDGGLLVLGGVAIALYTWVHRPIGLRSIGEGTFQPLSNSMVVEPWAFYLAMAVALAAVLGGLVRMVR